MKKSIPLIAKYFTKIYKPTNNNFKTLSNSRNKNVDSTPRTRNDRQTEKFRNQRTIIVAGARETETKLGKRLFLPQGEDDVVQARRESKDSGVIIEQRVKVNQKARILELTRRYHEEHCSNNQYAVYIKEDMAYLCLILHSASRKRRLIRHQYGVFSQLNMAYRPSDIAEVHDQVFDQEAPYIFGRTRTSITINKEDFQDNES
ncbi:hypothetical protein Tco_0576742 [Tanacetum coccineum]